MTPILFLFFTSFKNHTVFISRFVMHFVKGDISHLFVVKVFTGSSLRRVMMAFVKSQLVAQIKF